MASITTEVDLTRWFAEEVQPHEAVLRSWLRRRVPNLSDTDDIIQEAYARVLQAQRNGNVRIPKAFLFATAANLVHNRIRHLHYELPPNSLTETVDLTVLDEGPSVPEALSHNEEMELLTRAIQSLPKRCRQVFTLRRIYNLSQKEVAARLGISEHTVEAQSAIAFRKCLKFYRRHGDIRP